MQRRCHFLRGRGRSLADRGRLANGAAGMVPMSGEDGGAGRVRPARAEGDRRLRTSRTRPAPGYRSTSRESDAASRAGLATANAEGAPHVSEYQYYEFQAIDRALR